jgi:hypothetical protein
MDENPESDFIDMESLNLKQILDKPNQQPPDTHTPNYLDSDFIDMESLNLTQILDKPNQQPPDTHRFSNEYLTEGILLVIKNNIFNLFDMIIDAEDNENIKSVEIYINLLINTIIINGKTLEQYKSITYNIQEKILSISNSYRTMCLHKMIYNILHCRSCDNIHFRVIQPIVTKYPPIPEDIRKNIELKLPQFKYSKQMQSLSNKQPPQFKVDQIVGCRDITHRWWLSRVLHVHNDSNSKFYWYYVHFEGWPKCSREWICSSSYSIRKFNPKRHILKRS